MDRRAICSVGLAMLAAGLVLSGCGGGGGELTITGLYVGAMEGDGSGPLRFTIDGNGGLVGNFRLPPICAGPIVITGTADPAGNVTFQGTACGITFSGTGTIQRLAPGSNQFVGSGTWQGTGGSSGTWSVTRTGTGSA